MRHGVSRLHSGRRRTRWELFFTTPPKKQRHHVFLRDTSDFEGHTGTGITILEVFEPRITEGPRYGSKSRYHLFRQSPPGSSFTLVESCHRPHLFDSYPDTEGGIAHQLLFVRAPRPRLQLSGRQSGLPLARGE